MKKFVALVLAAFVVSGCYVVRSPMAPMMSMDEETMMRPLPPPPPDSRPAYTSYTGVQGPQPWTAERAIRELPPGPYAVAIPGLGKRLTRIEQDQTDLFHSAEYQQRQICALQGKCPKPATGKK